MRISERPTDHILVKAHTESEWDCCNFALVTLSDTWKHRQATRYKAIETYKGDYSFCSLNFYDGAADFYQSGVENEDVTVWLGNRGWAFMEIEASEEERLIPSESILDGYRIVIYHNGNIRYEAYGKHTNEMFWTDELPLEELIGQSKTDLNEYEKHNRFCLLGEFKERMQRWWQETDFKMMERLTGYRQADFPSDEGYQAFVDACNAWWNKKRYDEQCQIWEENGCDMKTKIRQSNEPCTRRVVRCGRCNSTEVDIRALVSPNLDNAFAAYCDGNTLEESTTCYCRECGEWTFPIFEQEVISVEKPDTNAEISESLGYLTEQLCRNGGGWDLTNDEGKTTVFDAEKQVYISDLILSKDNTPCAVIPLGYFENDTIRAIVKIISL